MFLADRFFADCTVKFSSASAVSVLKRLSILRTQPKNSSFGGRTNFVLHYTTENTALHSTQFSEIFAYRTKQDQTRERARLKQFYVLENIIITCLPGHTVSSPIGLPWFVGLGSGRVGLCRVVSGCVGLCQVGYGTVGLGMGGKACVGGLVCTHSDRPRVIL